MMRAGALIIGAVGVGLALVPALAANNFTMTLFTRLLIFALAASSLNLVLGYGGMVSFGHAAYFGVGGYVIGILTVSGIASPFITWTLAVVVCALLAAVIGAISLRTQGVYFIMITLAFAQMLFFVFVSLRQFGGADGLPIRPPDPLRDGRTLYYITLITLGICLFLLWRIKESRFGRTVQAIKENETRMMALGYPVFRYQLVCFIIGGALAGLAGVLNANLNSFISPNALAWSQSGQFMMMVILGGVGRFWGGTLGAVVFIMLETWLGGLTIHWQLGVGAALLMIVLFAPGGLVGLMSSANTWLAKRRAAA
jgi:branched-chain amino acid transport system permease protein